MDKQKVVLITGCSSGIEPLFAVAYRRRALEGQEFDEVHPLFLEKLREFGLPAAEWVPRLVELLGRLEQPYVVLGNHDVGDDRQAGCRPERFLHRLVHPQRGAEHARLFA